MKNLHYIVHQLSRDDRSYTIDLLLDIIMGLEKDLDQNEKAVNELNKENKELKAKMKKMLTVEFDVEVEAWQKF